MSDSPDLDVTKVLERVNAGDSLAAKELLPLVYGELRKLATSRMRQTPPGQTLQPTALVHEVYLRLVGEQDSHWEGRRHFFFAAARAMRDIIVEQARQKASLKRGSDRQRVGLTAIELAVDEPPEEVLALNEALAKLEQTDSDAARLVMLRYFVRLTATETASVMGISVSTVERKWRFARACLRRELADPGDCVGSDDE